MSNGGKPPVEVVVTGNLSIHYYKCGKVKVVFLRSEESPPLVGRGNSLEEATLALLAAAKEDKEAGT